MWKIVCSYSRAEPGGWTATGQVRTFYLDNANVDPKIVARAALGVMVDVSPVPPGFKPAVYMGLQYNDGPPHQAVFVWTGREWVGE